MNFNTIVRVKLCRTLTKCHLSPQNLLKSILANLTLSIFLHRGNENLREPIISVSDLYDDALGENVFKLDVKAIHT